MKCFFRKEGIPEEKLEEWSPLSLEIISIVGILHEKLFFRKVPSERLREKIDCCKRLYIVSGKPLGCKTPKVVE